MVRDPRLLWQGLRGGDPAAAEQDLRDLRQGLPLHAVASVRRGRGFRQGVLVMHLAAPERLTWRAWRPFRSYADPVPISGPVELLGVREPSSFRERQLGDVRIVTFRSGPQTFEMAVVTLDAAVVTAALTEAGTWTPPS
ncbi:hypothetical protein ACOALZ_04675 [Nocardiopsis algeriensis]|uniref:hypothetical protein n=1 Tax=Nocardiopsis algeriensis TaxID=1478215 RepID=UPI003B42B3E9